MVKFAKANDLSRWEVIDAENELGKAVQAKNSCYWVQKVGLNAEACITSQTIRLVEPTFNPMMNVGETRVDVEQETVYYHGWSITPTEGQGIPDCVDAPLEQYNGITRMIRTTLAKGKHTDPDKSVLITASIKLDHPETYVGGSDLKEFEVFMASILRWLKMNCLLREASIDMQVNYVGTHLTGEVQEWFYRNVE